MAERENRENAGKNSEMNMSLRKSRKWCIDLFVVLLVLFAASPVPVFAASYQVVHVMIAYDDELANTATYLYGRSPETFCRLILEEVSDRFQTTFGIKFITIRVVSWDSDNSNTNDVAGLLQECINETGFYSGMVYNTIPIDILVAFSDQHIHEAPLHPEVEDYGYAGSQWSVGAVIVIEHYWWPSPGQATDNILQHELSHLYDCENFWDYKIDCTMCEYPHHELLAGFLPWGFYTDNWCAACHDMIMANKARWGREEMEGGGGCPILSVYNGKEYVEEGLLNIHNAQCEDVLTTYTLTVHPQPVSGFYLLRLTEHPKTNSHIDQVRLFSILSDGTMVKLPLVSAEHCVQGSVLLQLLFSDDWRVGTSANQTIDLKFLALPLSAKSFIFVIEGYNPIFKIP